MNPRVPQCCSTTCGHLTSALCLQLMGEFPIRKRHWRCCFLMYSVWFIYSISFHWSTQSNSGLYPYIKEALEKITCSRWDLMRKLYHSQIFCNKTSQGKKSIKNHQDWFQYLSTSSFFSSANIFHQAKLRKPVTKEISVSWWKCTRTVAQIKWNSQGKWMPEMTAFIRSYHHSFSFPQFLWMLFKGSIASPLQSRPSGHGP